MAVAITGLNIVSVKMGYGSIAGIPPFVSFMRMSGRTAGNVLVEFIVEEQFSEWPIASNANWTARWRDAVKNAALEAGYTIPEDPEWLPQPV
jgi:hypothetical protein